MKLVKCKFLIDGTGAAAEADVGMLVDGERILEVKPLAACKDLPADIEIIDLSNSWVMPGIINAHTHLSLVPGKGNQPAQKRLPPGINVQVEHFEARGSRMAHVRAVSVVVSLHFKLRRRRRFLPQGFALSL